MSLTKTGYKVTVSKRTIHRGNDGPQYSSIQAPRAANRCRNRHKSPELAARQVHRACRSSNNAEVHRPDIPGRKDPCIVNRRCINLEACGRDDDGQGNYRSGGNCVFRFVPAISSCMYIFSLFFPLFS